MIRRGVGAAAVLAACFLLPWLGECSTDQSSFSASYGDCEEDTSLIADGICDSAADTAACGFDGGDCCECTCFVGGVLCAKTESEFACEDPEAPTDCGPTANSAPSSTSTLEESNCVGYVPHIQDGYCDEENNNAACDFDGGDCCACTCGEGLAHPCGVDGEGFDCQDPDVPSNCSLSLPGCGGDVGSIQNSYCDSTLNNEECGYDGGDCCKCTCREYGYYDSCGTYGFDCIDPSAPIDCATDSPTPSPTVAGYPDCEGNGFYIGDGKCDSSSNTLECGWDGGDCCRCSCIPDSYSCLYFDCLDPSAATDCATESPSGSPYGSYQSSYVTSLSATTSVSDRYQSSYVNSPSSTTSLSDDFQAIEYDAEDTISRGNSSEADEYVCQEPVWRVSDGRCHLAANTQVCGWDGGDCCECTCVDGRFSCGEAGYRCRDTARGGGCPESTAAPGSELAGLDDPGTSLTKGGVFGVVFIAVFGFVSIAVFILFALVVIRGKCEAIVP